MSTTTSKQLFDVDKEGLAALLEKRGKAFAILELIQNALDEDVTEVTVTLEPAGRNRCTLIVEDDDPDGFTDLSHAYTLFARSEKVADATKRGRFNLGEKLVIAVCDEALIESTKGAVKFTKDGRQQLRTKRKAGSKFTGTIRMNQEEYAEACSIVYTLLIPAKVKVTFNGEVLEVRQPLRSFRESLPTEVADDEGILRPTTRKADIRVYEVLGGETAHLYEMGIPVVETDLPWHVDVGQKVPLNFDRDNVTPRYKQKLARITLDHMADQLSEDEAASGWVQRAMQDPDISAEAVEAVLTQRFGDKRVIADLNDPEANKIAAAQGYTVIPGGSFKGDAWKNIKRHGAAAPAGQVTPSPKPFGEGDESFKYRDPADWTPLQRAMVEYSKELARKLMGVEVEVRIIDDIKWNRAAACYGPRRGGREGELTLGWRQLGRRWFEAGPSQEVNDLLIHEFGHHYSLDHLSRDYYKALTRLGAKLVDVVYFEREWYDQQIATFNESIMVAASS